MNFGVRISDCGFCEVVSMLKSEFRHSGHELRLHGKDSIDSYGSYHD